MRTPIHRYSLELYLLAPGDDAKRLLLEPHAETNAGLM